MGHKASRSHGGCRALSPSDLAKRMYTKVFWLVRYSIPDPSETPRPVATNPLIDDGMTRAASPLGSGQLPICFRYFQSGGK